MIIGWNEGIGSIVHLGAPASRSGGRKGSLFGETLGVVVGELLTFMWIWMASCSDRGMTEACHEGHS